MSEPKLRARLWVQARIRQCDAEGLPAVVARRGDPDAGAVLVKLNQGARGCVVLTQVRTAEGRLAWMRGTGPDPVPEAQADAYIERQTRYDEDLWVLEIEDRDGRHDIGGPVVE